MYLGQHEEREAQQVEQGQRGERGGHVQGVAQRNVGGEGEDGHQQWDGCVHRPRHGHGNGIPVKQSKRRFVEMHYKLQMQKI